MVPFALCGPVSAIGSEHQEGGEKGDGDPALGAENAGDAADEGEGDHRISALALAVRAIRSASWLEGLSDLGLPRFTPREQATALSWSA